jgi:acetamidase/formamidase
MTRLSSLQIAILGGVMAAACHTPPSINSPAGSAPMSGNGPRVSATELPASSWLATAKPLDWSTPRPATVHTLMPTPQTVAWGWYDAAGTPVLHVNSGDDVIVRALSTCSPTSLVRAGLDSSRVEKEARAIYAARSSMRTGPGGHILTGPIYVEGADSGDVLEVRFKSIRPAIDYACNSFGPRSGFLPEDFPGTSKSRIIELDTVNNLGKFSDGIVIPLHPFFGSVGVAPPASHGRVNSAPPGIHAGNLDNKELVAGTALFIPVWTNGALLNVGDGHAGQGNGEVDITAMETSLTGRLQLIVHKDMHLTWPRAETPTHYIAMGTDSALVKATKTAVREAIQLLVDMKGMKREDAYQLVSVSSDVDITQLVDGTVGVHVMIPKRIFVH